MFLSHSFFCISQKFFIDCWIPSCAKVIATGIGGICHWGFPTGLPNKNRNPGNGESAIDSGPAFFTHPAIMAVCIPMGGLKPQRALSVR